VVALAVLSLLTAVAALVLAGVALRVSRGPSRVPESPDALPEDVLGLRQEVAALRAEGRSALRHLAVVRYDAFEEMGGHLSWSVAILDEAGDGLVLTSIHGRSEGRTYAKSVAAWTAEVQLSPEEQSAIDQARRTA